MKLATKVLKLAMAKQQYSRRQAACCKLPAMLLLALASKLRLRLLTKQW
jgi:hypothetical protein